MTHLLSQALDTLKPSSILDLEGLGREEWRGTSAASHVQDERDSWIDRFIKEHPIYLPEVEPLFELAAAGRRQLVTSTLTLLELLVVPYRSGNRRLTADALQLAAALDQRCRVFLANDRRVPDVAGLRVVTLAAA